MKASTNSVRIIGGKWRSRKLCFPDTAGLRPTADRVRETLFNWLQMPVLDEDCLDLFAGSGACGIEALSRGARHVSFVDSSPVALAALRLNLESLEAPGCKLYQQEAARFLQGWATVPPDGRRQFGIVFVDPPFALNVLEPICEMLESSGALKPEALIYIESGASLTHVRLPDNWQMLKSKRAGLVHFCLCLRANTASERVTTASLSGDQR